MVTTGRLHILLAGCLVLGCIPTLSMAGTNTARLKNRIHVLKQAQQQAKEELQAKEQDQKATEADRLHQQKVNVFLQKQLNEVCGQLQVAGQDVTGLPCEQKPVKPLSINNNTGKAKPPTNEKSQTLHKVQQNKSVKPASRQQAVKKKIPEPIAPRPTTPPVEKKPQSMLKTLAQWLKSLFMPKPPTPPSSLPTSAQNTPDNKETNDKQKKQQPKQKPSTAQQTSTAPPVNNKKSNGQNQEKRTDGAKESRKPTRPPAASKKTEQTYKAQKGQQLSKKPTSAKKRDNGLTKNNTLGKSINAAQKQTPKSQKSVGPSKGQTTRKHTHKQNTSHPKKNEPSGNTLKKHKNRDQTHPLHNPGTTGQATIRKLEHSLSTSLGQFDTTLQQAQERLATRIPSRRAGRIETTNGGTSTAAGLPTVDNNGKAGTQDQTGGVSATGGGLKGGTGKNSIDADDDIVARQLREAAEKEKDPMLKKKLWQEYKKYKAGK